MRDSVFGGPQGIWHHHQLHPNSSFRATAQASDLPRRPPWGYTLGMPPLRQPEEFRAFFGLQRPRQWFCLRCQKRLFGASPEAPTNGQASLYPPPRDWPKELAKLGLGNAQITSRSNQRGTSTRFPWSPHAAPLGEVYHHERIGLPMRVLSDSWAKGAGSVRKAS
jgi:hypothetical protein